MSGNVGLFGFKEFGLKCLIDQEKPILLIKTILKKKKLPNALLFTGIEGIGKMVAAQGFAMACNCYKNLIPDDQLEQDAFSTLPENSHSDIEPCGICKSCKKILSGNHPDVLIVEPTGNFIKIDQIRALCRTLTIKPYEAGFRIIIISNAQSLNPESSNALLKILEEPPDRTIFVLTAVQLSDLLPTIVSRCQNVRFNPVSPQKIEIFLSETLGVNQSDAEILAPMANGSLSKAMDMAKSGDSKNWIKKRNWLLNEIESLSYEHIGLLLALAEKLSKKKDHISESLEIILTWFRDLIIQKFNPEKIIYKDLGDKVKSASNLCSTKSLYSKIDAVYEAQKKINVNANLRLTVELMLIKLI